MSAEAVEHGWFGLSAFDRQQILRGVICAEATPVTLDELVDLVSGRHGGVLQRTFVDAISSGVLHPARSGLLSSFAAVCIFENNLEPLRRMVAAAGDVLVHGTVPVSKSLWLDMLCTSVSTSPTVVVRRVSLFREVAARVDSSTASLEALSFALEHQPEHPDVEALLGWGGSAAALMAQAILMRRLAADSAPTPAAPCAVARPAPRRSRVV